MLRDGTDLDALAARIEAGRQFDFEYEGVAFTLRRPTEHEIRVAFDAVKTREEAVILRAQPWRALLERAVLGWSGLTAGHLCEGAGEAPVEFSAKALGLLLEDRMDVTDALRDAIMARIGQRRLALEEARKNSSTASSGTSTSPSARPSSASRKNNTEARVHN